MFAPSVRSFSFIFFGVAFVVVVANNSTESTNATTPTPTPTPTPSPTQPPPCVLKQCSLNSDNCTEVNGQAKCNCKAGYEGDRCELDINECNPDPCKNSGSCQNEIAKYTCKCPDNIYGRNCDTIGCVANICKGQGTCNENADGSFNCTCNEAFEGETCEFVKRPCDSQPCHNKGSCVKTAPGKFQCYCASPWGGTQCEAKECPFGTGIIRVLYLDNVEPFVFRKKDVTVNDTATLDTLDGYCIDLFRIMMEDLNCRNYDLKAEKEAGIHLDDDTFTGIFGKLINNEADMAIGPLTINKARANKVDFTRPWQTLGTTALMKRPQPQQFYFQFLQPFGSRLWGSLAGAMVFSALCYWIIVFLQNKLLSSEEEVRFLECIWLTVTGVLGQGHDPMPEGLPIRLFSVGWWILIFIGTNCYVANLAAFMTANQITSTVSDVDELVKTDKIWGWTETGATFDFFAETTVERIKKLQTSVDARWGGGSLFRDEWEALNAVQNQLSVGGEKQDYVYFADSLELLYHAQKNCDLMVIPEVINEFGYGFALRRDPINDNLGKLMKVLNEEILKLSAEGFFKSERKKWFSDEHCGEQSGGETHVEMWVSDFAGVYFILIGFLVISLISLAILALIKTSDLSRGNSVSSDSSANKCEEKQNSNII